MYEQSKAELNMVSTFLEGASVNPSIYDLHVLSYEKAKECIYLVLEDGGLDEISLDAVYECRIMTKDKILACEGVVKERFEDKKGKRVTFSIENGFYEKNIK